MEARIVRDRRSHDPAIKLAIPLRSCSRTISPAIQIARRCKDRKVARFYEAIPIPSSKAIMVEKVFNLAAQKLGFEFVAKKFDSISDGRKFLKAQIDGDSSLFYAQIPGGTILLHHVEEKEKFPAQFGREVLAGLLNMADNADWRNRKHSKDEEMNIVEDFKSRFQEYDPNC